MAGNASLQAAGITLNTAATGSALVFGNTRGESLDVSASGDIANQLGLGSFRNNSATGVVAGGTFDYSTTVGTGGTFAAGAESLEISVGGGAAGPGAAPAPRPALHLGARRLRAKRICAVRVNTGKAARQGIRIAQHLETHRAGHRRDLDQPNLDAVGKLVTLAGAFSAQ